MVAVVSIASRCSLLTNQLWWALESRTQFDHGYVEPSTNPRICFKPVAHFEANFNSKAAHVKTEHRGHLFVKGKPPSLAERPTSPGSNRNLNPPAGSSSNDPASFYFNLREGASKKLRKDKLSKVGLFYYLS